MKKDLIVGTKNKLGLVHVAFQKFQVLAYLRDSLEKIMEAVSDASLDLKADLLEKVLPRFVDAENMADVYSKKSPIRTTMG